MNRILTLIQEMREPNMTLSFFLKSPALQKFCDEYNSQSLAEIHISFTNMNRFRAILQKQQLLSFPAGQDYNEVLFQLDQNSALKDYVQNIHQNEEDLMIICMLKEQAALLLSLSSFEVDMSYKHIKSSKMNEVIFATYLPQHGKIITLCRIFTEQENPERYYHLFQQTFAVVQKLQNQSVSFDYLHELKIQAIIVDMCTKQMTGLAQYLASIDPEHRSFDWQLKNILIFYHIHFFRSISNIVGTQNQGTSAWNHMTSLLNCKSQDDYMKLCNLLILYDSVRNHTNAAEQTHNKFYAFERGQSLLQRVL
ncbi:hypothetical protein BDDG_09650, partial [Blastomyces dermatitidis ATCC 18188]